MPVRYEKIKNIYWIYEVELKVLNIKKIYIKTYKYNGLLISNFAL